MNLADVVQKSRSTNVIDLSVQEGRELEAITVE